MTTWLLTLRNRAAHRMNLRSMTGSMLTMLWVDACTLDTFFSGQVLQMLPRLRQTFVASGSQLYIRWERENSFWRMCTPTRKMSTEKLAGIRSLDFVIDRLFMKLFRTNNMDTVTVRHCQHLKNKCSTVAEIGDRLASIDMGRKLCGCYASFLRGGGAGSPSNTVWPGPRPTFVPSSILIHPAVWSQQTWVENWGGDCAPLGTGSWVLI